MYTVCSSLFLAVPSRMKSMLFNSGICQLNDTYRKARSACVNYMRRKFHVSPSDSVEMFIKHKLSSLAYEYSNERELIMYNIIFRNVDYAFDNDTDIPICAGCHCLLGFDQPRPTGAPNITCAVSCPKHTRGIPILLCDRCTGHYECMFNNFYCRCTKTRSIDATYICTPKKLKKLC